MAGPNQHGLSPSRVNHVLSAQTAIYFLGDGPATAVAVRSVVDVTAEVGVKSSLVDHGSAKGVSIPATFTVGVYATPPAKGVSGSGQICASSATSGVGHYSAKLCVTLTVIDSVDEKPAVSVPVEPDSRSQSRSVVKS